MHLQVRGTPCRFIARLSIESIASLNAPTGAWYSLPHKGEYPEREIGLSQCTYRCVVLPDSRLPTRLLKRLVSMHLQVRGAP